ncbi:MAG: N-acyl homoserine lactonase family protein [Pseudomonadota bacterium]
MTPRRLFATCLMLCGLGGCTGSPVDPVAPDSDALPNAGPRLYVIDCGRIELTSVDAFGLTNKQTPVRSLFVPCYLIEHAEGRLLFDLGLPLDIAGKGKVEYQPGAYMQQDLDLAAQLNTLGLTPDDIDLISISHAHFDHVGAANAFPNARVVLQRAEYEAAFVQPEAFQVYVPELYAGLRSSEFQLLDGDHDLFGDGSVQFVATPGHTPGHQALLVNLQTYGPILLSGDLYHFAESRALQSVPVFNTDRAQTLASMKKVEQLLQTTGATLWIEHNLVLAASLEQAPAYYD